MRKQSIDFFVCPQTRESLTVKDFQGSSDRIEEGCLASKSGNEYFIKDGIPDFTIYIEREKNEYAINLFKEKAKEYDTYQHLGFQTFYEDETTVRNSLIDKLQLKEDSRVLEVNAGTGRDSVLLAKRLSAKGLLHVQDISRDMLEVCKTKLDLLEIPNEMHQGNASRLPYRDKMFDAVYSFGGVGMNTYSNNKEALAEMVRVTKPGGKIVFGGLSLAPWLRSTLFGKVLTNHNAHYANEITFTDFPVAARNVQLSWILAGAGFVIDFEVGEGEPAADFNYSIPGVRGGTLMTRYTGSLEGVTPETKKLAQKAREHSGLSMHDWIEKVITEAANKELKSSI